MNRATRSIAVASCLCVGLAAPLVAAAGPRAASHPSAATISASTPKPAELPMADTPRWQQHRMG